MLELQLKSRIVALARVGRDREVKATLRALDMISKARKELEEEGLICGNWIDVPKVAKIHRIWSTFDFEDSFRAIKKRASIASDSWSKEDATRAIKLLRSEDVAGSIATLTVTTMNQDIAVQTFKTALVDPDFLDVYQQKITYHIPRENWINGLVEVWAKKLSEQGVDQDENKPYLKSLVEQILGGLGE